MQKDAIHIQHTYRPQKAIVVNKTIDSLSKQTWPVNGKLPRLLFVLPFCLKYLLSGLLPGNSVLNTHFVFFKKSKSFLLKIKLTMYLKLYP